MGNGSNVATLDTVNKKVVLYIRLKKKPLLHLSAELTLDGILNIINFSIHLKLNKFTADL